ncbi:MAG: dTDP-4-dehydrorhamnose 3,5-epimerase family protein [Flavobacteriales bacterium]|nr:dTDP-4-dehydrorhamnose 3,5-epimerase family protein [Flavobacteriales bacterium]
MIADLIVTPLRRIENVKGDIYHALKCSESSFSQFGEAYFSTVLPSEIKGWKKHAKMVLNLIVPVGAVRFVLFDDRVNSKTYGQFYEEILSADNYCRLTVPAGIWMAFQGNGPDLNLLLNIASIEHDPLEAQTVSLDHFNYDWSSK